MNIINTIKGELYLLLSVCALEQKQIPRDLRKLGSLRSGTFYNFKISHLTTFNSGRGLELDK